MAVYIDKELEKLTEDVITSVVNPEPDNPFKINNNIQRLNKELAILSHWTITKILFVIKHAGKYIHPNNELLITRLQETDKDNWKKIRLLLKYLHGTCEMAIHLNYNNLDIIH